MSSSNKSGRRSRWLANYPGTRQFLKLFTLSALALIVIYFVVTSSVFLKSVVLPRVGKSLNASIEVGDLSVSAFSRVHLTNLRVVPAGEDKPLLEADEALARYNLFSLIRGKVAVSEVRLVRPVVHVVHRADGKANYGPMLPSGPSKPASPSNTAPDVRIGRVEVQEGTLRFTQQSADGSSRASTIAKLRVLLENVANETTGKLDFSADLSQLNQGPTNRLAASGGLAAQATGAISFGFDKDFAPAGAEGEVKIGVTSAAGAFADMTDVRATLACDVTTNEVRQLSLAVARRDQPLGQIRVTGPVDLGRSEARLTVRMDAIDRNLLNLAGAAFGLDFAETTISGSHLLDVSRRGELITAKGSLKADRLAVKRGDLATPPIDLTVGYQVSVSFEEKAVKSQEFAVAASQAGTPFLNAKLKRALSLTWGQAGTATDSSMDLAVTNLNLANWRLLLPTNVVSGIVNVGVDVSFQDEGKRLSGDVTGTVANLGLTYGPYGVSGAAVDLRTRVLVNDYRSILLEDFRFAVQEQGQALVSATGGAGYDTVSSDTTLEANVTAELPVLLTKVTVPGLQASAGRVVLAALANQDKGQTKATLNLALSQFSGRYGEFRFRDYDARLEADGEILGQELNLRRLTLGSRQGTADGGSVDLSGKYHLVRRDGDFRLVIANLNQSALAPMLDPMLAPLALASIAVDGDGTLKYAEAGPSSVALKANILKLRLVDPQRRLPGEDLDFHFELEASQRGPKLEIPRVLLALPRTDRATNQIELTGAIDLATNAPAPSTLRLAADSLDFTPLYDLFMTNRAPAAAAPAPSAAPGPDTEPAAVQLPIRQLTANARVGRMFLRSLAVTNLQATLGITNDVVTLAPFSFGLNGAPVAADAKIDLSRPGYGYDVSLRADAIPLGPIAQTFEYDRAGEVKGSLTASAQVQGAGVTGANLQKHLAGQFDLATTNLSLAIGNVRSKLLTATINSIIAIPDLIKNPAAALDGLVGRLTGGRRSEGGWVDEVTKAPIDTIALRGRAGAGKVELETALVRSPAFRAETRGEIGLQPVLTNSTVRLPVTLALRRELAEKVGFRDAPVGTGATNYVQLPDFLTLGGTVGAPKSEVNAAGLIAVTARAGAGLLGNTGNKTLDQAAGILGNLGNALTGPPAGGAATNATAGAKTNQPAPFNPLDLLRSAPKKN